MTRALADMFFLKKGKLIDKWEQFLGIYERELARFRASGLAIDLLEIGVQNGGSLELWADYLPAGSTITGLDIDLKVGDLVFDNDSIRAHVADATDPAALADVLGARSFDIIIDDGSHTSSDIIATLQALFGRLKPGGVYIVEDLHCSYYATHEGGFRQAGTSIEWLKRLVDAVNYDHVDPKAVDAEERRWLADMNRSIAGISFFDSVVVIEKFSSEKNRPFRRIYSGSESEVAPAADWMAVVPRDHLDAMLFGNAAARALDANLMAEVEQARGDAARKAAQLSRLSAAQAALEEAVENARRARESLEADARASREVAVQTVSDRAQAQEDELRSRLKVAEDRLTVVLTERDAAQTQALQIADARQTESQESTARALADRTALELVEARLRAAEDLAGALSREVSSLRSTLEDRIDQLKAMSERGVVLMESNTAVAASILSYFQEGGATRRAAVGRMARLARRARRGAAQVPQKLDALRGPNALRGLSGMRSRFRKRPDQAQLDLIACLFASDWYQKSHPEIAASGLSPLDHYARIGSAKGWDPHPLFSLAWYGGQVPGIARSRIDPVAHYLTVGAAAGLQPHPLFDGSWYLRNNPDVRAAGLNPLLHYLNSGRAEERNPHELFDAAWYLETYPQAARSKVTPLEHFVMSGPTSGLDPHPLFSSEFYIESHPEVASSGVLPVVHYITHRHRERHDPHPLFDVGYYLDANPDVRDAGRDALSHYLDVGAAEGRAPNTGFASRWYLDKNHDVAVLGVNPLRHYVERGASEGRAPHPAFDLKEHAEPAAFGQPWGRLAHLVRDTMPAAIGAIEASGMFAVDWYAGQVQSHETHGGLVRHYLSVGTVQDLSPHPLFDARWYAARYPDSAALHPFLHYALYGAAEGRQPGPLVQPGYFAAHRGHPHEADLDPLAFFVRHGLGTADSTSPLFDARWYRSRYADLLDGEHEPLLHYATVGMSTELSPNPLFDPDWYEAKYAATAETGLTAFEHYTAVGWQRGVSAGPFFDAGFYTRTYADVADDGVDPLIHYLSNGRIEGRQTFAPGNTPKIAVIFHLYYEELLPQIRSKLKSIGQVYDLYVTHPQTTDAKILRQLSRLAPHTTLIQVADIGFDIAPFFIALNQIRESGKQYLCVCKIHTKKGRTKPAVWRHVALNSVLGSRALVDDIIRGFQQDPSLALVGSQSFYLHGDMFSRDNLEFVTKIQKDLYDKLYTGRWGFFAGTMFWFRPENFYELADMLGRHYDFESSARNDGQVAHAIERMLGLVVAEKRKRVGLVEFGPDGQARWDRHIQVAGSWTSTEPVHSFLERIADLVELDLPVPGRTRSHSSRRWTPQPRQPFGVRLVGPIRAINGIAVSTRGYLRALQSAGVQASVCDWKIGFERLKMVDLDLPADGDRPIQITHLNLDLLDQISAFASAEFEKLLQPSRYNILVPYFELVSLKPEWVDILARFDEVWCASTFLQRALAASSPIRTRVVRPAIVPETIEAGGLSRDDLGLPQDRFVFGYFADAGSVLGRKNPLAFVEAYVNEFTEEEGACCYIKIHYGLEGDATLARIAEIASRRRDVIFSMEVYSHQEMMSLVALLDCYVSPHRSEGLGLTIVEAMNVGVPVIATNYGGAIDMLDPTSSVPVPYRLKEVGPNNEPYPPFYTWADPEAAELRAAMRGLVSDRGRAKRLGQAGRSHVNSLFGLETTGSAVRAALDDIWRTAATARGER